jgi:dihydroxyacetone kinase
MGCSRNLKGALSRAVKTGGSANFGPAHSGFVGSTLKSPDKKRMQNQGPSPARFLKKIYIFKAIDEG